MIIILKLSVLNACAASTHPSGKDPFLLSMPKIMADKFGDRCLQLISLPPRNVPHLLARPKITWGGEQWTRNTDVTLKRLGQNSRESRGCVTTRPRVNEQESSTAGHSQLRTAGRQHDGPPPQAAEATPPARAPCRKPLSPTPPRTCPFPEAGSARRSLPFSRDGLYAAARPAPPLAPPPAERGGGARAPLCAPPGPARPTRSSGGQPSRRWAWRSEREGGSCGPGGPGARPYHWRGSAAAWPRRPVLLGSACPPAPPRLWGRGLGASPRAAERCGGRRVIGSCCCVPAGVAALGLGALGGACEGRAGLGWAARVRGAGEVLLADAVLPGAALGKALLRAVAFCEIKGRGEQFPK